MRASARTRGSSASSSARSCYRCSCKSQSRDTLWPYYPISSIPLATLSLQVLAVQFGGRALRCAEGGLTTHQWLFCVGAGLFSLVWQQALNCYSLLSRRVDARRKRIKKKPAHGGAVKFMSRTGNGFQEFRRSNPYLGKSLSTLRFSPSSKTAPDLISAVAGTGPVAVSRPSSY